MMVPLWLYISSGAQPCDFFLYCLGHILHSVIPVSPRCNTNEIKLHQHKAVQLWNKQSPYLYVSFAMSLWAYTYLQLPFLVSLHLILQTCLLYIQLPSLWSIWSRQLCWGRGFWNISVKEWEILATLAFILVVITVTVNKRHKGMPTQNTASEDCIFLFKWHIYFNSSLLFPLGKAIVVANVCISENNDTFPIVSSTFFFFNEQ